MDSKLKIFTLEEIAKHFPLIILDTCGIGIRREESRSEDRKVLSKYFASINVIRDFIQEEKNLYVTSKILKEIIPDEKIEPNLDLKKCYKGIKKRKGFLGCDEHTNHMKRFKKRISYPAKLAKDLLKFNRIIDFTNSQYYSPLQEAYLNIQKKYKLSNADYDILIHSILLSNIQPTAIISNDGGILRGYQELKKDNCISKNNLSFFFHHSIKKFKRIF